ncbi:HAD-IA family hydrolase [Microvirga sp. 2MCAF35]|uniref:HAD-IA family hydrolase n=1 Tax=Microvirga sp. 2MCAF35 TaxID=3232987 RepID=UPI003F9E9966
MQGKVFLFDMDGTLIDSNAIIEEIWHRWADRHGLDRQAVLAKAHGRQASETVRLFAPDCIDRDAETAWVNEQAAKKTKGIKAAPGAEDFLAQLRSTEWAIVTSAKRFIAEQWLEAAGLPRPETLIAADDVERSKPDPEGYRLAARRLGCAIDEAIVFEDAEAGLRAGRDAGAKVVGIGTSLHLSHLADAWIADFRKVRLSRKVLAGFRIQY